jgi:hypothetical protein
MVPKAGLYKGESLKSLIRSGDSIFHCVNAAVHDFTHLHAHSFYIALSNRSGNTQVTPESLRPSDFNYSPRYRGIGLGSHPIPQDRYLEAQTVTVRLKRLPAVQKEGRGMLD